MTLFIPPPHIKLRVLIPVAFAWALFSGLVMPSSLIASSVSEFSDIGSFGNPAVFLWYSFFQSLGLFVFWPLCIFFLFKERVQTLLTIVFSMGLVCSVVNAFLFVVNYGPMGITLTFDGDLQNSQPIQYMLFNLGIMLLLAGVILFLMTKRKQVVIGSLAVVTLITFGVLSLLNVRGINKDYAKFQEIKARNPVHSITMEPVFNFTQTGKNVIIIMLDRASSAYLEHIFNDQPDLYDSFDGFTYFKNTLAYHVSTLIASPPLYGGYEYTPDKINARTEDLLKDKHNESLLVMPRVVTEQADYSVVMSDTSWGNYSVVADMSFTEGYEKIKGVNLFQKYNDFLRKNLKLSDFSNNLETGLKRNLFWVSVFRTAPLLARPVIYYRGTYFNPEDIVYSGNFIGWFSALYALPFISDYTASNNTFSIITNEITHITFANNSIQLMEYNSLSYPNSVHYKENTLALKLLGKWFDMLKHNGVYDNTKIIVVSDHGIGPWGEAFAHGDFDTEILNENLNGLSKDNLHPLLLYKDFNASGSLQVDLNFMTTADVPILVLEGVVDNPVNPFTKKEINSELKERGVYTTIYDPLWLPEHSKSEYIFTVPDDSWYHVKDNIFIASNWTQEVPR